VLRDLMVVPYLQRDPHRALGWMDALALAGGLVALGALLAIFLSQFGLGLILAAIAVLFLGYAVCVRSNLERWLRAQQEKTFRIRGATRRPVPARETARRRAGVRL
jgi:hypothetical protein